MLTYILVTLLIGGLGYAGLHFWQKRIQEEVVEGAEFEYTHYARNESELVDHLNKDEFSTIYARVHSPRFPAYAYVTVMIFLIGAPILLAIQSGLAYLSVRWGLIPQPGDAATSLYLNADGASIIRRTDTTTLSYILQGWSGFYYFFGLLFFWIGLVTVMMRRYHRRSTGSLRDELMRSQ